MPASGCSEAAVADQLDRLGGEHGVTYVTTFEHSAEALTAAVTRARRSGR